VRGALDAFARETEPPDGAVERLRGAHVPRAIAALRPVDEVAAARLGARIRSRRAPRRVGPVVLALGACAAGVALLLAPPSAPRALDQALTSSTPAQLTLTDDVTLSFTGTGHAAGPPSAPHIQWDVGTLDVDVTPHRGIDLVVDTLEGRVHVLGTAFTVRRDALGTAVVVLRGTVEVACGVEALVRVDAGGVRTCLPTRAAGWLGRARALRDAGAPADAVLDAIDRGRALGDDGDDALGELAALRLDVLVVAGRYTEALDAADAYLRSGASARRAEVEALAARLRTQP
jgi:ferric-dicitrate binding protein FerR (iron transport regulator)